MLWLLLACGGDKPWEAPGDLGQNPADAVKLVDSPLLAYLALALPGGDALTAGDLLRGTPTMTAAPDPSAVLIEDAANNPTRDGVPLRFLSYNVALLDVDLFGFIPYKKTPFLDERRDELPALILGEGYDILCLQEVWVDEDLARFKAEADSRGYLAFYGPRDEYTDGVLTLIKKDLIQGEAKVHAEYYQQSDPQEYSPGPHMRRGFIEVAFQHPTLGLVRVYNTHLLAWPKNWQFRMSQARQLGLRVASQSADGGLALAAGDMNATSYYASDTWLNPEGETEDVWWENTMSYAFLQYYGQMRDLYIQGAGPDKATLDISLSQKVQAGTPPGGRYDLSAHCDDLGYPRHITTTDCNILYGMQYKDTENPARMDLIFAHDPDHRVTVASADTAFTERRSFDGSPQMEISDHLGVALELRIAVPGAAELAPTPDDAATGEAAQDAAPVE